MIELICAMEVSATLLAPIMIGVSPTMFYEAVLVVKVKLAWMAYPMIIGIVFMARTSIIGIEKFLTSLAVSVMA